MVYFAYLLVPLVWFVLNRTTWGLRIKAAGQNPAAADALGVSIPRVRYATVTIGGILSSIAGASLSIALLNVFQQNLTSGMGFIAVALVYFGGWSPAGGTGRLAAVQHRQCAAELDPGAGHPHRAGFRRDAAVRPDDRDAGRSLPQGASAGGPHQTLRTRRGVR